MQRASAVCPLTNPSLYGSKHRVIQDAVFRHLQLCTKLLIAQIRNFPEPPTPGNFLNCCSANERRTAVQVGGVLQYKCEVYCGVSFSSSLGSQERTAM